ncbi:hypothetical protein COLO4_29657 [Corchorus olitorius]|uniref:Uncharacterized protein n=1 Tax=Corchorus olitorius TaxID=93759 RepID=A0A1R3HDS2_9ROSI|nr:hypothetical protein COLO4_29657 [Corchorus olitorius]
MVLLNTFLDYMGVNLVKMVLGFAGPKKGWERRKRNWHGRDRDLPRMALLSFLSNSIEPGRRAAAATLRFTLPLIFLSQ